ncbi:hypothetical protein GCM10007913_36530 [Devosia yakushimensis]|uniref:Uncharacterized protein n=1 Tax=Devosia yakushimensis TaxID=470028 RepID=A0ABQ5UJT2_9HYPH|nr:hypothetical protein [Devosia yakushimensis]GLQ11721.1 hypothetical protein GCM10007913_36530 [Devosia yakushimensis]
MEETWSLGGVSKGDTTTTPPLDPKPARQPAAGRILSFVVGLVGVAAIAASGWVYSATQRDIARISTDIAQIRLSLALYGQQGANAPATPTPAPAGNNAAMQDLANRLAILEQNWRSGSTTAPTALPAIPAPPAEAAAPTNAGGGDCLPDGMRILVSAGDSYDICNNPAKVEVAVVENGFITLAGGTTIASGATIPLPGSSCNISLMSSGDGGMTGFAEIRVKC